MNGDPEVVIVGAGPSGLAVGACLARQGRRALLLERGEAPGWSWVRHYAALRLHTSRALSELPGLALRSSSPYPDRAELAAYLSEYASKLSLQVDLGREATAVVREGGLWRIETTRGSVRARHVVLASGFFAAPRDPEWPGRDLFQGRWLRPEDDLDGEDWNGRRVLVVGLGNTAGDMIAELGRRGAQVAVAVRGPVHVVPLEILGVNSFRWAQWLPERTVSVGRRLGFTSLAERTAARAWFRLQERCFGDLRARGLVLKSADQIRLDQEAGRPPVVGGPWVGMVRRGETAVFPAIAEVTLEGAAFVDGRRERFDAILLATGWVESRFPLAGELPGSLRDGPVPGQPGLWLCGAAPALRHIRRSARRIASGIASQLAS